MNILYFIYPFIVDGHLGCFYFLAIVNNAARNIQVIAKLFPATKKTKTNKRLALSHGFKYVWCFKFLCYNSL